MTSPCGKKNRPQFAGAIPMLEPATRNQAMPAAHLYYLTYLAEALVGIEG